MPVFCTAFIRVKGCNVKVESSTFSPHSNWMIIQLFRVWVKWLKLNLSKIDPRMTRARIYFEEQYMISNACWPWLHGEGLWPWLYGESLWPRPYREGLPCKSELFLIQATIHQLSGWISNTAKNIPELLNAPKLGNDQEGQGWEKYLRFTIYKTIFR